MTQSVLNNQALTIYNSVSQGASLTSQTILAGAERSIHWMNLGISTQEFFVSLGINTFVMMGAEYISNSESKSKWAASMGESFAKFAESDYFKPACIIATLALSALITPKISSYFNWSISYGAALKIAVLNLSLRVTAYALYLLYEQCFLYTDQEQFLDAIKANPHAIKWASNRLLDDREVMREMISYLNDPELIKYTSFKLRDDQEFVLNIIKEFQCTSILKHVSKKLRDDQDFIIEAIQNLTGCALQYASAKLQDNRGVVLSAIKSDGAALAYASANLQKDEEIVLAAIRESEGRAFLYASNDLRNDKDFVKKVAQINAYHALRYASKKFQSNKSLVLEAVEKNGNALRYASPDLKKDEEVVFAAVDNNDDSSVFRYASDTLRSKPDFVLKILEENPGILPYVSQELRGNKEFLLEAIKKNADVVEEVDQDLLADSKQFFLEAIKRKSVALKCIPVKYKNNEEFLLKAVESGDEDTLNYADASNSDNEIVVAAITKRRRAIASQRFQEGHQSKQWSIFS